MREVNTFQPWQQAGGGRGVIETLFTFKDRLFIGSNVGMLAYNISDPSSPQYLSSYSHLTSCDPVVANDDYAFVTLRAGTACGATNTNQMDVLDIVDIMSPTIVQYGQLVKPTWLRHRQREEHGICL